MELPTSFANGRYEVKSLLGEGGKKKVYLVHDTTLDRDVAFGLIKAEGLDAEARQRITREAQAMGRLGDHPNIMPIHDLGDENGQPYMVQPVMDGGDVDALIEGADDGRLPLEDALRIVTEICRGLEFAHEKGIIHRDLKPGNVWLTSDGTARIGDFGLALSIDRSRLTQEKMMVGTVSYMPPEQATGGDVTARADLYSLGAMLYEMTTGRPPFMGDDDIAIIGQHINTPPVAPSWHNQSLPHTLDSLIMRLLSKNPSERPEGAREVLLALDAIDPTALRQAQDGDSAAAAGGSLDSMAGGVFVGRHREMDALKATFEETLGGHGKMAALVGEPGIGTTRTAQELATYANMRGGQVLWGRCYEGGGAPPYYPWVQAIRSYVTDKEADVVRREMGSTASVIAEIVPDVKERLPDVRAPQQIEDPESARFRLFDSITTFLKSASDAQPIVLMLEDLHWSDKPSLMLLEFVARELGNSRLMIVGNYRDMELNRRHPLSITLGELSRERLFDRALLRGLQNHDVRRFIEVAAGIDPPDALVDAVHTQTEGNPLFVTETVRLLIQEGDITSGAKTEGGTSSWEIRIPEGVREVIGRRLDRLSERCNEVLTTAAVVGRQFRFDVLMKLVDDASENMLLDVLDEALEARIVEEVGSEVGLYQFAHALMQETLSSELSANRTVRLHARIAEALEKFYGSAADEHAAELVVHLAEAEVLLGAEKVVHYSLAAGESSMVSYAYEDAIQHFARGLDLHTSRDAIGAQLNIGLARALMHTSSRIEMQAACSALTTAYDIYDEIGTDKQEMIRLFTQFPLMPVQGIIGMASLYQRALKLVEHDTPDYIDLLIGQGHWARYELYDDPLANQSAEEAVEWGTSHDDSLRTLRGLLISKQLFGLVDGDPSGITLVESLVDQVNDPTDKRFACEFLGKSWARNGNLVRAEHWLRRGLEVAIDSRNRWNLAASTGDLIQVLLIGGQISEAVVTADNGIKQSPEEGRVLQAALLAHALSGDVDITKELVTATTRSWPSGTPVQKIYGAWSSITASWELGVDLINQQALDITAEFDTTNPLIPARIRYLMRIWLGLAALIQNDENEVAIRYEQIRDERRVPEEIPSGSWPGAHFPALMAAYLGRYDEAEAHYGRALDRAAAYTSPTLRARIISDYATMLFERNAPGDREKAIEFQDEAIAIATDLGMKPLLERVLAQREILKA